MSTRHLATALALVGALAILSGSYAAHRIQTQGGQISVTDLRFTGASGRDLSALLYLPPGASAEHRVPGILAVHGYINSRETQSAFAIELARRGHAVLALDQTGHGFSAPPAFADGFGGPDGLAKLRGLPMVDAENIGLNGHSMGGWAVLAAAASDPDGYRSMVLAGSGPGVFGAPEATPAFPRNLAVIFSAWDEFSELMWQVPTGAAITNSERLAQVFDTVPPVQAGALQGSIEDGTARILHVPPLTHPGDHLSATATAQTVDWFERTLEGGSALSPDDQVWFGKEMATGIALLGLLLFLPSAAVAGHAASKADVSPRGARWRLLPAALVPVLTYFPCFLLADAVLSPGGLWPQPLTNGLMLWLALNTAVSLSLNLPRLRALVPTREDPVPVARVLLALGVAYVALAWVASTWHVDWRFWVLAIKPLAPWHWPILAAYLPVLLIGFAAIALVLHRGLGHDPDRPVSMAARNAAVLAGPFGALLAIQYGGLFLGAPLPLGQPLLTIVAIQFAPVLAFVAVASTVLHQRTGRLWPGAVLNAGLVGWLVVAGTATT